MSKTTYLSQQIDEEKQTRGYTHRVSIALDNNLNSSFSVFFSVTVVGTKVLKQTKCISTDKRAQTNVISSCEYVHPRCKVNLENRE
jgi:hypothetical protein